VVVHADASGDVFGTAVERPSEAFHDQRGLSFGHLDPGIEPRSVRRHAYFVARGIGGFAVDSASELDGRVRVSRVRAEVKAFPVFIRYVVIRDTGVAPVGSAAASSFPGVFFHVDTNNFFHEHFAGVSRDQPRVWRFGVGDGTQADGVQPFPCRVLLPVARDFDWLKRVLDTLSRGGSDAGNIFDLAYRTRLAHRENNLYHGRAPFL